MKLMTPMLLLVAVMLASGCAKDENNEENPLPEFQLIYENKILDNNAKIIADTYIPEGELVSCNIELRNHTDQTLTVVVEKKVLSTAPANVAAINYFCWDKCWSASVNSGSSQVEPFVATNAPVLFTGDLETGTLPQEGKTEIKIQYTFTDQIHNFVQKVEVTYIYPKQS